MEELEAELASRRGNLVSAPSAGVTSAPSAQPVQSMLPTPGSDGRPKRASKVPMKHLKGQLGYDDEKWNALRDFTRTSLASARLDWRLSWKAQRPEKFAMVYNAIEEAFPETTRFAGQWGVDRIAKQCWDNHKNYRSCVVKPTTYRGRQAASRRAARAAADTAARSPSPSSDSQSDSHSRSPSAGPSRSRRARPLRVDSNDSNGSDSNRNGLEPCSDEDEDGEGRDDDDGDGAEEGEEEDPHLSEKAAGKRRAPSQGGTQRKRQHRDA
ncbi:hypothetical protein DFH08DRAFT_941121 [Mycena albidolilacea]|uniref:Uncharacterized protein n=1 Tax=Mycena albidolilacea TaxID=1033008 RepID=A0AAD6ZJ23_9AGAR|nr:hypothetical protein DFH08DRAFT_941121 [Mycena albidolilacea]